MIFFRIRHGLLFSRLQHETIFPIEDGEIFQGVLRAIPLAQAA